MRDTGTVVYHVITDSFLGQANKALLNLTIVERLKVQTLALITILTRAILSFSKSNK